MGRYRVTGISSCFDWDPRAMDDEVEDEWALPTDPEAEQEDEGQEEFDDDEFEDVEEEEVGEEEENTQILVTETYLEDGETDLVEDSGPLLGVSGGATDEEEDEETSQFAGKSSLAAAAEAVALEVAAAEEETALSGSVVDASADVGDSGMSKNQSGAEEQSVESGELHMYYSNLESLANIYRKEPNLTVLSLIGQPLVSLDGAENLKHLRELWAVECDLQNVSAVERCSTLEKLYLYSNRIREVPRLDGLPHLHVLWLASNDISDLRPVDGGRALVDLNLSKNRLSSLTSAHWLRCTALASLNLSGNPLFLLTDLLPLGDAPALRALQMADPMYGDSPVTQLCNYRSYIVHHVRNLISLEQLEVTVEERMAVDSFYAEKFLFYNMLRYHYRNLYMKEEKEQLTSFWRKIETYKGHRINYTLERLWGENKDVPGVVTAGSGGSGGTSGLGLLSDSLQTRVEHLKYKVKVFSKDLKDWRKCHAVSLQTRLQQVGLEQQHAGNLRFRDFSGDSEPMVICQRLLDSYICDHMRTQMGIESTQLLEVTHVTNKGLEVIADLRMGSKRRRSSTIMLLAPSDGLRQPTNWPFDIAKRGFVETHEYEVGVTNCLFYADPRWMEAAGNAKRQSSPALSDLAPTDGQYERRVAVIVIFSRDTVLVPCQRNHEETPAGAPTSSRASEQQGVSSKGSGAPDGVASGGAGEEPRPASSSMQSGTTHCSRRGRSCCRYLVANAQFVLAMIVLEFRYVFSDPLERFRQRMGWTTDVHEQCARPSGPRIDQLTEECLQDVLLRVRTALRTIDTTETNLVHLTLIGCGIMRLGQLQTVPTVQSINISFNKLSSLKGLEAFPNARLVDVSYNEMTLNATDSDATRARMPQLRTLDISWNSIGRLLAALPMLSKWAPQMTAFDTRHNPVEDLRDSLHATFFAKKAFPHLVHFDGEHIDDLLQVKRDSGCNAVWGDVLDLQVSERPLTLHWMVEARMAAGDGNMGEPCVSGAPPYWVCHKGLYLMDVKVTKDFENVRWADFSDNLLSDVKGLLVSLPLLEELSLRYNVIQNFPVLTPQWKHLRRLDMSRNYLKSIATLQCGCFPALELLDVSGNMLSDLNGIQSCEKLVECYAACNRITYEASLLPAKSCRALRMLDLTGNPVEKRRDFRAFCVFHIHDLDYLNGQGVEESDLAEASDMFGGCLDRDFLLKTPCALELSTLQSLTLVNSSLRKVNLPSSVLPQLEKLDLSNNCITYLWGLHLLPSLKTLRLSYNQVTAMRPPTGGLPSGSDTTSCGGDGASHLSRCPTPASAAAVAAAGASPFPKLQMLLLDNNHVGCCKLLGLREMPCLSTLFLQHNDIGSFDGLQGISSLRFLVVDDNKIQSITSSECRGLNDLEELWLENNRVSQLYFTKALTGLKRLFLAGNSIADITQLRHLTQLQGLREVTLWGNPIARRPNFQAPLRESVPWLELLDGEPLDNGGTQNADTDSNCSR